MDLFDAIQKRRSIRSYVEKPISDDVFEKIIDAARFAPTARNVQPWEFIIVTDHAVLKKLADIADYGKFIAQAAACVAVYCKDTKYYLEDGSAATQNILLAASALGVGSCWVAGDKKPYCADISELLGVPPSHKLVSLISLGYPKSKDELKPARKRPVDEMVHWEKF
jgi:nitroreductase